ncbi:MAG: cytochrome c oxidase accessory protein CcoG [Campylobacteraceae bacterium]|jgi:cytochrome c oxidase accessory protein FixG|nr:cytochrome c oxidase accessory protein CcoG [Campylobacteraceae bacterium]
MSLISSVKYVLYSKKRHVVFAAITLAALILPWITVGGRHFFLLSFDKKQLQLLFTAFDMQELYLVPFLLIILFLGIFFITTLGGRVWCGWSCPQTIFRYVYRDILQTKVFGIYKSVENKQNMQSGKWLQRVLAFLIFAALSVVAASDFLWYFIPPEDFFVYIQDPAEHKIVLVALGVFSLFIIALPALLKEKFCVYVCPYVRIQSAMFDDDTVQTIYNSKLGGVIYDEHGKKLRDKGEGRDEACTGCEACVKICPAHIDIRAGMQLECINCLECSDACTKVMRKLKKPPLISWTSPNAILKNEKVKFVRFRTVAYVVVLSIVLCALVIVGSKREHMLLNINRGTQLFSVSNDKGGIENAYTFLFQNTDSKGHKYYFEVLNKDISIVLPKEPFNLSAGASLKKIVVLRSDIGSSLSENEGKPLSVKVRAYAQDDEENIFVEKEIMFFYPKASDIHK